MNGIDQLTRIVSELVEWRNGVVSKSKQTDELDSKSVLEDDDLVRIFDGESKKIEVEKFIENISGVELTVTERNIGVEDIDTEDNEGLFEEVIDYINNDFDKFEVGINELLIYKLPFFADSGHFNDNSYTYQTYFYIHAAKPGEYGDGGSKTVSKTDLIGPISGQETLGIADLGESLDQDEISDYIDDHGPYNEKIFKAEDDYYFYIGPYNYIGEGESNTTDDDFIKIDVDNDDSIAFATKRWIKNNIDSTTDDLNDVAQRGNETEVRLIGSEWFEAKEDEHFTQRKDIDKYKLSILEDMTIPDYAGSLESQVDFLYND